MNLRRNYLLLAALTLCVAARAQEIDLIGNTGWEKHGSRIRIHAQEIHNNRDTASGPLRLQIWATTDVYDGVSDITGYVLGTYNLRSLPGGSSLLDRSRFMRYRKPPPGLYYTTITLEEKAGGDFFIDDSENFAGRVNLGGFGEGTAHFDASNGDVSFLGDLSWLAGDGRVQIDLERVVNERASGRSGTLRVKLWATDAPFEGGTNSLVGFPLATRRVGRLSAMSEITFSGRAFFRPPPPGEYNIVMTLEEYNRGWYIRDFANFPGLSLF